MTKKRFWAVIPASGIGSRMQSTVPKQYLPFLQSTVIETTLNRLLDFDLIEGVVLVLSEQDQYFEALNYQHKKPVLLAQGASERSGSVLNGLNKLQQSVEAPDSIWVMIHDAVRPCITHDDLQLLIDSCENYKDGLFLAHPVADTLKKADVQNRCVATVEREHLWRAFTPQMFTLDLIQQALISVQKHALSITDDVSAVQHLDKFPQIILGRSDNIKITYPQDIYIAETIFKNQKLESTRSLK